MQIMTIEQYQQVMREQRIDSVEPLRRERARQTLSELMQGYRASPGAQQSADYPTKSGVNYCASDVR